jgi:tetratricopeptide (TPR) repeat protein
MRWRHGTRKLLVPIALLWMCAVSPLHAGEPEEILSSQKAYLFFEQGYILHLAGAYEKAVNSFSESIDLHPTAEAHTYRGWSLSMLGHLKEAIAECKAAIELDPDYGNPYNDIGVYLIDLGQPDEAIPWLKKAMRAKRYCCYQYPHFNLGRVLIMKGRVSEAKQAFRRALSYDPDYPPAQMLLEFIREQGLEPI